MNKRIHEDKTNTSGALMAVESPVQCSRRAEQTGVAVRSLVSGIVIVGVGIGCLGWVTDGFRAVLLETARRLEMAEQHPALPDTQVEDQMGNRFNLADLGGRYVVATFMYTRCMTLCSVTGADLAWLQRAMRGGDLDVQLLSVSFDARDDGAALKDYADRLRAQWPGWRVVRISDPADRQRFLRTMGVVAIPDGLGGFTHNAALYLMGPDRRIRTVFDIDAAPDVLAALAARG